MIERQTKEESYRFGYKTASGLFKKKIKTQER